MSTDIRTEAEESVRTARFGMPTRIASALEALQASEPVLGVGQREVDVAGGVLAVL